MTAKLKFLQTLKRRKKNFTDDEQNELQRLEKGKEGEATVLEYIAKFGGEKWTNFQNVWLDFHSPFECDILLATNKGLYSIEVKNLNGDFKYENDICYINGYQINQNYIFQTRRNSNNLKQILKRNHLSIEVQGVLVFAGVNNHIEINAEIEDIDIIARGQLRKFIENIKYSEGWHSHSKINLKQLTEILEQYSYQPESFLPKPLTFGEMKPLRKGISCAHCDSFAVTQTRKFITCMCGHVELRRDGVLRTIHEFGELTLYRDFFRSEIEQFLGGQVSQNYLLDILNDNFEQIYKNVHTFYRFSSLPPT